MSKEELDMNHFKQTLRYKMVRYVTVQIRTNTQTKVACTSDDWPAAPYWPIRQMDGMPEEM